MDYTLNGRETIVVIMNRILAVAKVRLWFVQLDRRIILFSEKLVRVIIHPMVGKSIILSFLIAPGAKPGA